MPNFDKKGHFSQNMINLPPLIGIRLNTASITKSKKPDSDITHQTAYNLTQLMKTLAKKIIICIKLAKHFCNK